MSIFKIKPVTFSGLKIIIKQNRKLGKAIIYIYEIEVDKKWFLT